MGESLWKSKLARAGVVVVAILAFVGWEFGIKASRARNEAWKGTLQEAYRTRDWLHGFKRFGEAEYRYYDHYWKVKCNDGKLRDVEVLHGQWNRAEPGDPIVKVRGERWPKVDTPEAEEQRRVRNEILNEALPWK